MDKTENIELSAGIDQNEIPKPRFLVILEKVSKVTRFVFFLDKFCYSIIVLYRRAVPKSCHLWIGAKWLDFGSGPIYLSA